MFQKDSLADGGFVVNSLTAVSVPACSYLVEEGAVDFVHLGAVHFGQSLRHES